jgi:hypothetical protein
MVVAFAAWVTAVPALAQSNVPKTPPPVISPTLPMTAPAPAPSPVPAPQVVLPPTAPAPAIAVPAVQPAAQAPKAAPAAKPIAQPPANAATSPPAAPTPAVSKTKTTAVSGKSCTRLPLSDIQFGRENTIKVAREKLEEYAQKVAKEKGWKNGYTRSNETATCEDYLWLPIGGQEYKCLVAATFCSK